MSSLMRKLAILGGLFACAPAWAGQNILTPMLGISHWKEETDHLALGSTLSFEQTNRNTAGFRYLYLFDNGMAVGGDIYWYKKNVTTISQADEAGVVHAHLLLEYFFNQQESVSQFVGGGVGRTTIVFSGGNLDNERSTGSSFELNGGVQIHISNRIGLQFEYKLSKFELDDNIGGLNARIDTIASSVLAGLSFSF